ncbi:MAG: winged helix-turn-helix transcriptional regulator [Thermoplasmatota archaeon]
MISSSPKGTPFRAALLLGLTSVLLFSVLLSVPTGSSTVSTSLYKGNLPGDTFDLVFDGPGKDPSLSLFLENGGALGSASLIIGTVPNRIGPETVEIDIGLDNRTEWSFGGGLQGRLGLQDTFSDGSVSLLDLTGSSPRSFSIYLPEDQKPAASSINVSFPPSPEGIRGVKMMTLKQHYFQLDSMDIADIEGDGKQELVYYDRDDRAVYSIGYGEGGVVQRTMLLGSVNGSVHLRAIGRSEGHPAVIIFSHGAKLNGSQEVSALVGNSTDSMETHLLSTGLPQGSSGFFAGTGKDGSVHVVTLSGSHGMIQMTSIGSDGKADTDTIVDATISSGALSYADVDGDGDMDILVFPDDPELGNVTLVEHSNDGPGSVYSIRDTGIDIGSTTVGAVVDIDGDGREEVYTLGSDLDRPLVLFFDGSGAAEARWIGFNHTSCSPRTISRSFYGDGGFYEGNQGFLYLMTFSGLYHVLPLQGPDSQHVWRRSNSFESIAIIDASKVPGNVIVLKGDLSLMNYELSWHHTREASLETSDGSTRLSIPTSAGRSTLNIGEFVSPQDGLPLLITKWGVELNRYDIVLRGSEGFVSLSDLFVRYDVALETSVSERFRPSLEKVLVEFDGEHVPFSVSASSSGTVRVGPSEIVHDSPPVIEDSMPMIIRTEEDSHGSTHFNVRDHIDDDNLPVQGLDVVLLPQDDMPPDLVYIDRYGNIGTQAFRCPDLYGTFQMRIQISDLRNTIVSDPVVVEVAPTQDTPVAMGGPGTIEVVEGTTTSLELEGEHGLFRDPDGDELSYSWELVTPNPRDLDENVDIWIENGKLFIRPDIRGTGGSARLYLYARDQDTTWDMAPLIVMPLAIIDVDAPPAIYRNPGTVYLLEDQTTPSRIPLFGWMVDPDTRLSDYSFYLRSSNPFLDAYIDNFGGEPYLYMHPHGDLVGEESILIEMSMGAISIIDRVKVVIEPVNDIPRVVIDGMEFLENRGWIISGHIDDPDSQEGRVEYMVGDGEWIRGWGFKSWSLLVDFRMIEGSTGFVFIRADDGDEVSSSIHTKLVKPFEIPDQPDPPTPPPDDGKEDPDDDDDDDGDPDEGTRILPEPSGDGPMLILIGGALGILGAALIGFLFTDVGIVIVATIGASIYSKLSRKDILNHEIRGLIRGYIIANPGDHYSSIKRNLDLNNGTLAYHLRVLEQSGFIKSMYDGIYKRYYPSNVNISKLKKNISKQEEIFNIILEHPGISMEQIGRMIGVSRQVVNYHVKNLIRTGMVTYSRDKKSAKFYPSDNGGSFEQT